MTAKWLTVVAEALVLLGFITLWSGWKGSATLTRAFPFHASAAQLTGSATGSYALIGVPSLAIGLALMLISLVWTAFDIVQK